MKKVLVTGATGFAGSWLTEYLVGLGEYEITGTFVTEESLKNVENVKNSVQFVKIDLLDKDSINNLVASCKPDLLFHLAALASPGASFKDPAGVITNNVTAQINLFEAIKDIGLLKSRILIVSSADIYGKVTSDNLPIDEDTPFNPTNPYAVSKLTQDYLALQYFLSYQLGVIRVRAFNHIGPRQAPGFVVSDFAKRIIDIEKGIIQPILQVGNLDAKRDFTDVRDMVKAYVAILEKGTIGEVYNVGSGLSHAMEEIVEILRSQSKKEFTIQLDPTLLRPSDTPDLRADTSKLKQVISWKPEIPLTQTLKDTLDYWRQIG